MPYYVLLSETERQRLEQAAAGSDLVQALLHRHEGPVLRFDHVQVSELVRAARFLDPALRPLIERMAACAGIPGP